MNVLSLFSGIGGLDLGVQRAGMTIVGQVEIDPWCRKILAKHWPEVPRHDDVRTCVQWWGGRDAPDLVAGGIPCQPSSRAGQRKAQADSRWLWPAFAGIIRHLRPAYVLVENPPGLLDPVAVKDDESRVVGYTRAPVEDVLGDLATLGYDAEWDCVPAAYVGAPHIRDRIFIVAYPHGKQLRVRAGGVPGQARTGEGEAPERERVRADARHGRPALADTVSAGLAQRQGKPRNHGTEFTPAQRGRDGTRDLADATGVRCGEGPRIFGRMGPAGRGWWPPEPALGRVAAGVPNRVDRLRGLGNAVVPQVAEHIGRLILAAAA